MGLFTRPFDGLTNTLHDTFGRNHATQREGRGTLTTKRRLLEVKRYSYALVLGLLVLFLEQVRAEERTREELLRTAGTLDLGGTESADGPPVRWFSLELAAGTGISIRVVSVDFTPVITILEPDSEPHLHPGRDGSAGITHTVVGDAGLQIGVSAAAGSSLPGEFAMRVTRLPVQERLSAGVSRVGVLAYDDESLDNGEPVDWWDLGVRTGDRFAVVAESRDFVPAIIGVLPGGAKLTPEQSPDGLSIVRFSTARNGTLHLGVSASNRGGRGSYKISVFHPAPPTPLEVGQEMTGSLSDTDDMIGGQPVDAYLVKGRPGERVTINLASEAFDTLLIVQEPDGTVDGNDDINEDNLNSGLTYSFRENSTLEVRVYAVNREERGPYTLKLTPAAPVQSIAPGSRLRGRLSVEDELFDGIYADRYTLRGAPGQAVSIYLESEEFDTYLVVIAPDGTPFENDDIDDQQSNSGLHFVFDTEGILEILVTGYSNEDVGEYLLRVEHGEPDESAPTARRRTLISGR